MASLVAKKNFPYYEIENANEYNTNHYGSRNRLQIWRRNYSSETLRNLNKIQNTYFKISVDKKTNKIVTLVCLCR